jgi:hypothetical protein
VYVAFEDGTGLTDCRGPLLLQDVDALYDRGAGVVDAGE